MTEQHSLKASLNPSVQMIFLAGPPGSGKTSLGSRACQVLGLRFLSLPDGPPEETRAALAAVIRERSADVVELPWSLQLTEGVLREARKAGRLIGLWAHPDDMQARSGRAEPLLTPSPILQRGGFGSRGTRCPEFRRIDRGCEVTLLLVRKSFDDALFKLKETIRQLVRPDARTQVEQAGLQHWAKGWQDEYRADRVAAELLAEAMARYVLERKAEGASVRTLNGVYDDLSAMAYLLFNYERPRGRRVFDLVYEGLSAFDYRRKFSDSPGVVARYKRTTRDFTRFLIRAGLKQRGES